MSEATKVRPDEQTRGGWRREERPGPVALHLGSCVFCRTLAALAHSRSWTSTSSATASGDGLGGPAATRRPR